VTAIASVSPATLAAAFGTYFPSSAGATLAKLTPEQRRYVRSIASMSYAQLAALSAPIQHPVVVRDEPPARIVRS
jgi:hypothetical protein